MIGWLIVAGVVVVAVGLGRWCRTRVCDEILASLDGMSVDEDAWWPADQDEEVLS